MKTKINTSKVQAYAENKARAFARAASVAAVAELRDIDYPGDQEIVVTPPEIKGDSVTASVGVRSPYAIVSELGSEKSEPKPYVSKLATDPVRRARILANAAASLKS